MKRPFFFLMFVITKGLISQTMDWTALPQTVNQTIYSSVVYNNQLIAGGSFTSASSTTTKKIGSWNGSSWSSLGNGIRGGLSPYVGELIVYSSELYASGRFDSAGTIAASKIAKWNGTTWSGFGTGSTNDNVLAMAFYNGELYAAGQFSVISGVPAKQIAKWNGSTWQQVGTGVNSGYSISDLCVYQNELYAVGNFDTIGNTPCQNIARWNGTNWNNVSSGLPLGFIGLHVWQNKLLIGASTATVNPFPTQIWQWNGSTLSLFSQQVNGGGTKFLTTSSGLYSASFLTGPTGKSQVWMWNSANSVWDTVGTKVQSINTLCEFNNEIYCAGNFKISTGAQADYIAKLVTTTGIKDNSTTENNFIKIYPNPVKNILKISIEDKSASDFSITILNVLGQIVNSESKFYSSNDEIDIINLSNGLYYLEVQNSSIKKVFKIVKE